MNQLSVIGFLCLSAGLAAMGCSPASTPAPATNAGTSDLDASAPPGESIGDGGTTAEQEVPPANGAADAAVLGGWHPGFGDGGATTGPDASGPAVQTITATVGPIAVDAGQETVVCITMRLSNAESAYVPRITVQLAHGSHHLVVYRSTATTESLTPTPCTTFQGILTGTGVPLMISEKPSDDLTFPQGVALKIAPQQMIELEAHYINSGSSTLQGTGTVHFETIPVTTPNIIESDFAFWGTTNIVLAPGNQTIGPLFAAGLAGTHGFALTTHQHRLGTEFKIWAANSATDTNHPPVADTTDWSNPPLYRLSPEIDFNGQNGLAYQCTWNNTTGQVVTFGESALQEMCVLWMYYYPTHGFDFRFQ
jgi:hypothetical protein